MEPSIPRLRFKRATFDSGGSVALVIPKDLAEHMEIKAGDTIYLQDEKGKYGRYLSIWTEKENKHPYPGDGDNSK